MTLQITNPYGQTETFYNVRSCKEINGIHHIELSNGNKFTVNCRKDGNCCAQVRLDKWLAEHPQAERYFGDLRSEKQHFKAVYKMYWFDYKPEYLNNSYRELYATYIER